MNCEKVFLMKKTKLKVNKILSIVVVSIFLFSCGNEKTGNGKVIKKEEENKKDTADTSKRLIDTVVLDADNKDMLTLKGGITIRYAEKGKGNTLKKGDMVSLKYKTFLPDGKLIDGSDIVGHPLSYFIGINMSVKGWDEAFLYLKPGDKIKLHLPAEKAYGKKGFGTMVPPDTDLDFDIEIIELVKPDITESGLQIFTLVKNEKGKKPVEGKTVEMHYYGWIYNDGKLFDSSHFNGKPHKFKVGGGEEILAWEEIVKLMRKGEKVLMVVPAELAYAEKGVPELVPANAKLVFIIELMDVY